MHAALTHKLDFPDAVGQQQAVGAERAHLGAHLPKDGLGAVGARQPAFAPRTLDLQDGSERDRGRRRDTRGTGPGMPVGKAEPCGHVPVSLPCTPPS